MSSTTQSPFAQLLKARIDEWTSRLPLALQQQFRDEFLPLVAHHDEALDIIETIWRREQRTYAFDESTGLARRRPFHRHLAQLLSETGRSDMAAIAVLFIDVNNLKRINDTCGHPAGDRAVTAVGQLLRETLRVDRPADIVMKADVTDDYSVARLGGDEFLAALELRSPDDIAAIAPRLRRRIDDPESQREHGYDASMTLTSAIGGVVYEVPRLRPTVPAMVLAHELVRLADEQMYGSKQDGLVHVVRARFTDQLEADLDRAITFA